MPEEEAFCVFVKLMQDYRLRELFKPSMAELGLCMYQFECMIQVETPTDVTEERLTLRLKTDLFSRSTSQSFTSISRPRAFTPPCTRPPGSSPSSSPPSLCLSPPGSSTSSCVRCVHWAGKKKKLSNVEPLLFSVHTGTVCTGVTPNELKEFKPISETLISSWSFTLNLTVSHFCAVTFPLLVTQWRCRRHLILFKCCPLSPPAGGKVRCVTNVSYQVIWY